MMVALTAVQWVELLVLRLVLQLVDEMDEMMVALPLEMMAEMTVVLSVDGMDEMMVALMAVHWVL